MKTAAVDGLSKGELRRFYQQGFCAKSGVFSEEDLEPLKTGLNDEITAEAEKLRAQGVIDDTFNHEPFETRLACLNEHEGAKAASVFQRVHDGRFDGAALLRTLRHEPLLRCVQDIVGADVVGSSAYRIRWKLPNQRDGIPWHQDSAYFEPHCDRHLIVTCWIALVDATVENGCLHVMPHANTGGVFRHCKTSGPYLFIPDRELPTGEPTACEMKAGSVLFFTNLTPHASFTNRTEGVRWSLDLRYQALDLPSNVGESPEDVTPGRDPTTMACYPPEADFVVRDTRHPENEVTSPTEFAQIRRRFSRNRPREPTRGWQPAPSSTGRRSGLNGAW